ncbi:hypothetical protein [Chitinophaga sp. CF418]|uniref:TapB family protein n=1 Tax=Chitinophaga sp. CF418 TaxID=1855287 RepID=UPI000917ECA1|nr:hypothetical protein [Chitinophaga sp. CF418]SHN01520.1 hypothetical protein SAMN05216311_104331 [Chitinophaga sp. CF418]
MRKILFFIACLLLTVNALSAQDCKNYYYMLNNAEVEMTMFDAKGTAVAKNVYNVLSVSKEGAASVSDFTSTLKDVKGKTISSGKGKFKCDGGAIMVDMKMSMPSLPQLQNMKMESEGNAFLNYPANLKDGQSLPDGAFEMSGNANGMDMSLQYKVTDRKVTGKEKVTTAGGSWDCYKITYNMSLSMKMMGMNIPIEMVAAEWFAPGFGVVKTETSKDGKPAGHMEITHVKK